MLFRAWALLGRVTYRVAGLVALPIFLNDTVRVKVALIDQKTNKILLAKTWIGPQKWELIGGGVNEKDEDMFVAAIREVLEETGHEIDQTQLEYLGEFSVRDYMARFKTHLFICRVDEFALKKPKIELLELAWLSVGKLTSARHPELIQEVQSGLK